MEVLRSEITEFASRSERTTRFTVRYNSLPSACCDRGTYTCGIAGSSIVPCLTSPTTPTIVSHGLNEVGLPHFTLPPMESPSGQRSVATASLMITARWLVG